ncbi:hypothetical protein GCM10010495_74420 [Kitasatospora herbaricolor]|nr:hypothetical protein GCM10010495_74420 [Kitasatospora herbaricolor]
MTRKRRGGRIPATGADTQVDREAAGGRVVGVDALAQLPELPRCGKDERVAVGGALARQGAARCSRAGGWWRKRVCGVG